MYFKLACGNIKKSIRDYAIYFITLVFGVCVFYAFNSIQTQTEALGLNDSTNQIIELLSMLIAGVSVFVAIVLGFLIVYASRYLIKRRKREFGVYLTLGMDKGKVARIIVYEALLVGLISLVVGIILGLLLSQGLFYLTAILFSVKIESFTFLFSGVAFARTIGCFVVIFLVALVFNVMTVSKYKLIDLINADHVSETVKLRSLPLSVVLFVISLVMIIVAYRLLVENGLMQVNGKFLASTILMLVGTFLFFFSLSGFLLRVVQSSKKLYWSGLNMFSLRQLNSKINTAFVSISIVCVALFLALTSTCGGLAICMTFNSDLERTTTYDASFTAYYATAPGSEQTPVQRVLFEAAATRGYDIVTILDAEAPGFDALVSRSAQTDYRYSSLTYGALLENVSYTFNRNFDTGAMDRTSLPLVSFSQYNALAELAGEPQVQLADDEFFIWCDFAEMQGFYKAFLKQDGTLEVDGRELHASEDGLKTMIAETSSLAMNTGAIVLPDALMPADSVIGYSIANVMYEGSREDTDPQLRASLVAAYGEDGAEGAITTGTYEGSADAPSIAPFTRTMTAIDVVEQAAGLSATIAYLAIYIGFVLLIACAAILALQQLSEAADNVTRYSLLAKLGADQHLVNKALGIQVGIYFLFPLVLALAHSIVALSVVDDVVAVMGYIHITEPLLITGALFLVIYGGYFLITYFTSRTMIGTRTRMRQN